MTRSRIDVGAHLLLGDRRADGQDHGECSWTLLADNMFEASPNRITRLERMPHSDDFWRLVRARAAADLAKAPAVIMG